MSKSRWATAAMQPEPHALVRLPAPCSQARVHSSMPTDTGSPYSWCATSRLRRPARRTERQPPTPSPRRYSGLTTSVAPSSAAVRSSRLPSGKRGNRTRNAHRQTFSAPVRHPQRQPARAPVGVSEAVVAAVRNARVIGRSVRQLHRVRLALEHQAVEVLAVVQRGFFKQCGARKVIDMKSEPGG